jgi:periplasmic protein TonB
LHCRPLNSGRFRYGVRFALQDCAMTSSRSHSTLISLTVHIAGIALLLWASKQIAPTVQSVGTQILHLTDPLLAPVPAATGGGGGARAMTPAAEGHLPKIAPRQFVPPSAVVNLQPKLVMEPAIVGPPELAVSSNIGDPLSQFTGTSAGTGSPAGIGNGRGTGVGDKVGPGAGAGDQPFGPVYRGGATGIVMPVLIHRVEPEFSEEARKSKYSGTVLIRAVIDRNGHPRDLQVVKSIGLGLDEKALEAVGQWVFKPGMKDGKPVAVSAVFEVGFHLL